MQNIRSNKSAIQLNELYRIFQPKKARESKNPLNVHHTKKLINSFIFLAKRPIKNCEKPSIFLYRKLA
jgi:hypothetical protein